MHIPHINSEIRKNRLFDTAGDPPGFSQELEGHIHNFCETVVDALIVLRNESESL